MKRSTLPLVRGVYSISHEMKQSTLVASGFEMHRKPTRQAEFLSRMDRLIPWAEFCKAIEPFYSKAGNGRPPIGLERRLRMYFTCYKATNATVWRQRLCRAAGHHHFTNKRAARNTPLTDTDKETNCQKSQVRARVEHPFCPFKNLFGFAKVRYRGLMKTANRTFALPALINIVKWEQPPRGEVRPA